MSTGFCTDLDVDLSLVADDTPNCMLNDCNNEAVMEGVCSIPCSCPQILCLGHYTREVPRWQYGAVIVCYICTPKTEANVGYFIRWEKLK